MDEAAATRFCVSRTDLHTTGLLPDPDAPTARALAEGGARLLPQRDREPGCIPVGGLPRWWRRATRG